MRSRYRFTLRPKWIVSHLLVLLLVVTMVNLGFWQLRRLDDKKAINRRITARMHTPVAPVNQVVSPGVAGRFDRSSLGQADAAEYRRVSVTGAYRADQEVLVRSRSLNGVPGSWVLTPLVQPDGTAVVVNRGWVANDGRAESVPSGAKAPAGEVTVTGLVQRTQARGRFGPTDPSSGRLTNLARADIGRLQQQVPERLLPLYVQLQGQAPPPATNGDAPQRLDDPSLDEGPHLSYAIQWFAFSALAVGGYPLILRRAARERATEQGPDDAVPAPATSDDRRPVPV